MEVGLEIVVCFVEGSIHGLSSLAVPHVCDTGQARAISISSTWVSCSKHEGTEPGSILLSLENVLGVFLPLWQRMQT